MTAAGDHDLVWKALADPTRREILDVLSRRAHGTGELVERFGRLSRTGVMKHLDVLEQAGLLIVRREGRARWNHLNVTPIQQIYDRWVHKHVRVAASAAARLKAHVEEQQGHAPQTPRDPAEPKPKP